MHLKVRVLECLPSGRHQNWQVDASQEVCLEQGSDVTCEQGKDDIPPLAPPATLPRTIPTQPQVV